jgi:hypothetical protein
MHKFLAENATRSYELGAEEKFLEFRAHAAAHRRCESPGCPNKATIHKHRSPHPGVSVWTSFCVGCAGRSAPSPAAARREGYHGREVRHSTH